MRLSQFGRLFLASLIACNGMPLLTASSTVPADRAMVVTDWAHALGMSGDAAKDELTTIEYWGTGTVNLNGAACALTSYHASVDYRIPGMRVEFSCVDASGQSHYETQVVSGKAAWNETASGSTSAMSARDERIAQLWSGPLALVKAASAAGDEANVTNEGGRLVVTFPVPGVSAATVKATLSGRLQAEQVDTRLGATVIQTNYSDYAELNGANLKFDTFFPRHIVQKQGDVTLIDLTVTQTSRSITDLVLIGRTDVTGSAYNVAAPAPLKAIEKAPESWKKNPAAWAKLDASIRATIEHGCDGPQSIIVRTKPGYRAGLRASLQAHGNPVNGEFPTINAVGAKVSCEDLATLAGFDSTLSVSVNAPVTSSQTADAVPTAEPVTTAEPTTAEAVTTAEPTTAEATTPSPTTTSEPAVDDRDLEGQAAAAMQAPMLQTLLGDNYEQIRSRVPENGSLGIAVIDSGLEAGPDFGDRITAFYDFTQGDVRAAAPSDGYGHGSHVAGLAASRYVGVDPHARVIGLKVLDSNGRGSSDAVLRAVEFAIANKDLLNIQILNMSLGHPIYESAATDPLVQAVETAVRSGLVVVVAAGNVGLKPHTLVPGYSGIVSPANAPSIFSIGAVRTHNTSTRSDDQIALFSSRGPSRYDGFAKPDFSAPGQNVLSVAPVGSTLRISEGAKGNVVGNYMRLNGTSMAAGVVSGMVALMLETNPSLTPNALKAALEYSSIDVNDLTYTGSADFLTQGAGEISGGALALAASIDTSAPSGTPWLTAAVSPSTTIDGVATPWAKRLLFGNYPVSGDDLLNEQRPAYALNAVWGNSLDENVDNTVSSNSLEGDDDNAVWGNSLTDDLDNIVWGNSLSDELDNIVWGNSLADGLDNIVWGNSTEAVIDNSEPSSPSSGGGGGGWLNSPATSIVIRSTAYRTFSKQRHHSAAGRGN